MRWNPRTGEPISRWAPERGYSGAARELYEQDVRWACEQVRQGQTLGGSCNTRFSEAVSSSYEGGDSERERERIREAVRDAIRRVDSGEPERGSYTRAVRAAMDCFGRGYLGTLATELTADIEDEVCTRGMESLTSFDEYRARRRERGELLDEA
tara:strand:- start:5800 stop:6261 length:462 start_codon:yes stop_codon:yes gene_type:complete